MGTNEERIHNDNEKPVSKTGKFFGRLLFFVVLLAIIAGTVLLTDYIISLFSK